ncbi:MAG: DNA polymerase III subunit chi [Pseudomonadota bacterium]
MAEAVFYQLSRRSLEQALPDLLGKTLQKRWRAVVRCGSEARVGSLNRQLWTFGEASFLPHGTAADGHAERQPIYLTAGAERPNDADALFLVDGAQAEEGELRAYARCLWIFDGADPAALQIARAAWKAAVAAEVDAVYWAETPSGGWERKSEKRAAGAS